MAKHEELQAKIDQLEAEANQLKQENAQLNAGITELQAYSDKQKEVIEQLSSENNKLTQDLQQQQAAYDQLSIEKNAADATISNLLMQVKAVAEESIPSSVTVLTEKKTVELPEPVEVDGMKVKFLKPLFNLHGTDYTASQAAGNTDIIKALLAIEGQQIVAVMA